MASAQSSQDMWRGRDRQPQILGNAQPRHRSESRRVSDRKRQARATARERDCCPGVLQEGASSFGPLRGIPFSAIPCPKSWSGFPNSRLLKEFPVRVFSRSAGKWVDGDIMQTLGEDFVRVEYDVGEFRCGKIICLHSEHLLIAASTITSMLMRFLFASIYNNNRKRMSRAYRELKQQYEECGIVPLLRVLEQFSVDTDDPFWQMENEDAYADYLILIEEVGQKITYNGSLVAAVLFHISISARPGHKDMISAMTAIKKFCSCHPDSLFMQLALLSLSCIAEPGEKGAISEILRYLTVRYQHWHGEVAEVASIVLALLVRSADKWVVDELVTLLELPTSHPRDSVIPDCLGLVARLGGLCCMEELLPLLQHSRKDVRYKATMALKSVAKPGDENAIAAVADCLEKWKIAEVGLSVREQVLLVQESEVGLKSEAEAAASALQALAPQGDQQVSAMLTRAIEKDHPVAYEDSLSYIHRRAQGMHAKLPDGYIYSSRRILKHISSGIYLWCIALKPEEDIADDSIVLFHYTCEAAFWDICGKAREIWPTLLKTCSNPYDTCYGDGVYATQKAPHHFGSKKNVLVNNYNGVWDALEDRADYCVPIIVRPSLAKEVQREDIPGLHMRWNLKHDRSPLKHDPEDDIASIEHRAGFDRHGRPLDSERDIWVIPARCVQVTEPMHQRAQCPDWPVRAAAANVVDMNLLLELCRDAVPDVRKCAVEAMASSSDERALDAVIASLKNDKSGGVRKQAINSLSKLAKRGDATSYKRGLDAVTECLKDPSEEVRFREQALEVLSNLAQPGDVTAIMACAAVCVEQHGSDYDDYADVDFNSELTCKAIRALTKLAKRGDETAITAVLSCLEQGGSNEELEAALEAISILANAKDKRAIHAVSAASLRLSRGGGPAFDMEELFEEFDGNHSAYEDYLSGIDDMIWGPRSERKYEYLEEDSEGEMRLRVNEFEDSEEEMRLLVDDALRRLGR